MENKEMKKQIYRKLYHLSEDIKALTVSHKEGTENGAEAFTDTKKRTRS